MQNPISKVYPPIHKPNLFLMRGIPGSGKSTEACRLRDYAVKNGLPYKVIDKDKLRLMLDGNHAFGFVHEDYLNKIVDDMIYTTLSHNISVIVDETHTYIKEIERKQRRFSSMCYTFLVEEMDTPLEECVRRDSERASPVGRQIIEEYAELFRREGKWNED